MSSWTRRRFVLLAALVVVVVLGVVVAWCSVYPERPSVWPYRTDVLWEFRLLNPSWPFWVGDGGFRVLMYVRSLNFLGYPLIERGWSLVSPSGLDWLSWRAMVNQEFFMWLTVINVVSGVLGFFFSRIVVRRFRLKDSGR